jgi:hypothetical protein
VLKKYRLAWLVAGLLSAVTVIGAAGQKSTGTPNGITNAKENRLTAAEDEVRQLLLIMEPSAKGKVSKKEFMSFMDTEFDRLDAKHAGEVDLSLLAKNRALPSAGR